MDNTLLYRMDPRYKLNEEGRFEMLPQFFPSQGADGNAHVTYFDERSQASFIWDGDSDVIQVCLGGYGEPVDHTIEMGTSIRLLKPPMLLRAFAEYCLAHANTLPTYGQEDR